MVLTGVASAQVKPGDAFPPLPSTPSPEAAAKVTLVDFWASWCAPCKASFPVYTKLQADYAARGLLIVAVSVDDDASAFESFVAKLKPGFATVLDKGHRLVSTVKVPTMPTSYLLDAKGTVRFVHTGFHGATTDREIRGEIEQILKENP